MKMPSCTVCQMVYNEGERTPMMLQCGHSFCKECLAHMFEAGPISGTAGGTHALICPRCRQSTEVGNSVEALRKNFALLSLLCIKESIIRRGAEEEDDDEEEEDEEEQEEEDDYDEEGGESSRGCVGGGGMLDLGSHSIRLVKLLGSGPRHGQELWDGILIGLAGCKHKAAVKRLSIPEGMDVEWVQRRVESLRRASTWCQNACALYGACQKEGKLCIVSRKYPSSVLSEMQQNEGRLSFEQILRYGADIARGVAELHAAGVVCMNLKPSNLLLDTRGRAAVSDFGLPEILKKPRCRKVRPLTTTSNTTAATASTSSVEDGSSMRLHSCMECTMLNPHYTAPEAWEPVKKSSLNLFWEDGTGMSVESDAWSFGCTLVEMCTGAVPWAGLSTEEIYKAVKARRQPPQYVGVVGAGIPRELWKMIGECLQFKPSKRPTFHAMLSTFLRHLQEMPLSPPQSPDNDPSKDSETTGTEPSPPSVLEFLQESQNVLHRLVSEYNVEGVRDLLAKASGNSVGALLDSRNAEGQTALHLAAMRGYSEIVKAILEHPEADADALDKDGDTPIVFAFASGTPDCLELLIQRGADVNARLKEGLGPSVAHMCCFYGDPECMKVLLSAGADPNVADSEGETVLHRAIEKKRTECAVVILENGGCKSMSSLNSKGLTPLHLCIATANVSVVERWVAVTTPEEIKVTIDIQGPSGSALCMAAAHKKAHEAESRELVRILLAAGANSCITDKLSGHTPLHAAAIANDVEMVELMLDSGIDVDIRDIRNTTALHVSLARGSKACVGLLLERGANCNLQDDEGDNAFHIAADMAKMVRENLEWIAVMLNIENTAIDARNHNGRTLKDFVEALPREWISEDLMEALAEKGIHLTPTVFEPADWVKYKRTVKVPKYGWQGANPNCVGFVQSLPDESHLIISICTGEARVLKEEVIKVIPLDRGQHVQLRKNIKEPKYGWRGQSRDSIGTVLCVDDDGILRVGFPGASRGWKADPAEMERVEEFQVRDWVRIRPSLTSVKHGLGSVTPGSIGVVYSIRPDNSLLLDINYLQGPWRCEPEEVERVEPFKVGDRVCVRRSVAEPRYAWGGETHHSVGRISEIGGDALLIIDIAERPMPWQADPSDMEKVEDFKVGDWVRVKASVSSPKYGWDDVTRRCVGIVHSLDEEGDMGVGFCFRSKPFACSITDMEKVAPYEVGQEIHIISSVTEPRLGWLGETSATTGKIGRIDMDGTLNVRVAGRSTVWKVSPGDAECLSGFEVGDWVKLKSNGGVKPSYDWHGISKESSAVVHSVSDNGYLELACCFRSGRWMAHYSEVEKVPSFKVGQHVQFRSGLLSEPRWGWRGCSPNSKGVIVGVHADGEVRVAFPGLLAPWRADPADLELEDMFEVGDWVRVEVEDADTNSPVSSELKVGRRKLVRSGSIGIVQGIVYEEERGVLVGFCGEPGRWLGLPQELRKVEPFQVGQRVRVKESVKQPRFGWSGQDHSSLGTVLAIDADARLRVHPLGGCNNKAWMLDPAEVEVVTEKPTCIGNWVRVCASVRTPAHQWGPVSHQSVGVVHKISDSEDGDLCVAFCFLERLWLCKPVEMERVEPFCIGDKVRIKRSVVTPRWGWGIETYASRGKVIGVDADGKLRIRFRWREGRPWIGDPADIELDSSS